jgi:hypothetical protein
MTRVIARVYRHDVDGRIARDGTRSAAWSIEAGIATATRAKGTLTEGALTGPHTSDGAAERPVLFSILFFSHLDATCLQLSEMAKRYSVERLSETDSSIDELTNGVKNESLASLRAVFRFSPRSPQHMALRENLAQLIVTQRESRATHFHRENLAQLIVTQRESRATHRHTERISRNSFPQRESRATHFHRENLAQLIVTQRESRATHCHTENLTELVNLETFVHKITVSGPN